MLYVLVVVSLSWLRHSVRTSQKSPPESRSFRKERDSGGDSCRLSKERTMSPFERQLHVSPPSLSYTSQVATFITRIYYEIVINLVRAAHHETFEKILIFRYFCRIYFRGGFGLFHKHSNRRGLVLIVFDLRSIALTESFLADLTSSTRTVFLSETSLRP